jgi:hypothetical protein
LGQPTVSGPNCWVSCASCALGLVFGSLVTAARAGRCRLYLYRRAEGTPGARSHAGRMLVTRTNISGAAVSETGGATGPPGTPLYHIISATSTDAIGLDFVEDPGVRIEQVGRTVCAAAPHCGPA